MEGILLLVLLGILLLLFGVPVGFAFLVSAFLITFHIGMDPRMVLSFGIVDIMSFPLLALPLFIMLGGLVEIGGISDRLLNWVNIVLARMKSRAGFTTVVGCMLFGAISGSGASAIGAIGKIMIPRMEQEGYPRSYATSLVAVSSMLTLLIPPSIPMIAFALVTRLSVIACFTATLVPGVMLAGLYVIINAFAVRRFKNVQTPSKISFKEQTTKIAKTTVGSFPAIILPIFVVGGIYAGIYTPTEAAAAAVIFALVVGFLIYRGLTVKNTLQSLFESGLVSGSIIFVLFALGMLSRIMIEAGVHRALINLFADVLNVYVVLLILNVFLIVIGMLMDDVSGSVVAGITLLPVATAAGIEPLHFAGIVGVTLGLGNVTPPVAPLLYMAGGVGKLPLEEYVVPSVILMCLGHLPLIILVTLFPAISLTLPRLLGFL